ncbi:hypothetical protein ACTXT7_012285 [Hymenolepis weldensis]
MGDDFYSTIPLADRINLLLLKKQYPRSLTRRSTVSILRPQKILGQCLLDLSLCHRREFLWIFTADDVPNPISIQFSPQSLSLLISFYAASQSHQIHLY